MSRAKVFAWFIAIEAAVLIVLCLSAAREVSSREPEMSLKRSLVRAMKLTDAAFWTEARYTRHPSQADIFTAFQDFPSSPDHFPAGSIVPPRLGPL